MANFTGVECLVCKENFKENDDIVVCPECGTPYHRECYHKEGKCINEKLHEENKSWSQEREENEKNKPVICKHCGEENKPHSFLCQKCGASLVDNIKFEDIKTDNNVGGQRSSFTFNIGDKYCGMNPEEEIADDVKISEAADFIGTNVPYYLMLFKKMKDTGKKISLCAISLLFPQLYFANRKMWKETILTTVIVTLLSIPYAIQSLMTVAESAEVYLANNDTTNVIINNLMSLNINKTYLNIAAYLSNYASLALSVLAFLFSNWLYYRHMQKKITNIKKQYSSQNEISAKIASAGGTSFAGIILALVLQFILSAILVFILMYI